MDVDGEGEPGVVPASWWVSGWLMMGMSAEEQVSVEVGGGFTWIFLEGGYLLPITGPSYGREQAVFSCSWALNKCFL